MCDTLTVTPTASADGIALLTKNFDREPNEAHEIVLLPAMDHAAGSPCVARTGVHQGALCHS